MLRKAILCLMLLWLLGLNSFGQEAKPADNDDLDARYAAAKARLDEIVVTGSRQQDSLFYSPLSIATVAQQYLRERNPRTPAEALKYEPGIWIQQTGHIGGAPVIRGFMGNRVIYLFDGIRRNTAGLFSGPNSFLQDIDALSFNRLEVLRGPGSVLYGSDAIGGVVNVISKEDPIFSDKFNVGGRSYARYGSADHEMSARQELYFSSPKVYGFIGGTYRDISDLTGGRGDGVQSPSGWREHDWDAQLSFGNTGRRLDMFIQNLNRPRAYRYDKPNRLSETKRQLYGFQYLRDDLGFADDFKLSGYYHNQESFTDETHWDSDGQDQTYGGEVQLTSQVVERVKLTYGVHYHHDNIKSNDPQSGTEDPTVDWSNPAVFALTQWQSTDRLRLDLGLRLDRFNLQSDAPAFSKLDPTVQAAISNNALTLSDLELDRTDDALTGGVGAVYALNDYLNLVANIGKAFRAPNKADMLDFGQFTFGYKVPSPGLKPESSWTYETGLKASSENFAGSITGYYTQINDAIVREPGTFNGSDYIDANGNGSKDADEQVYVNTNSTDKLYVYGTELEGRWYLPEEWTRVAVAENPLSVYGNFTWMFGEDTGSGEPLDRATPANGLFGIRLENDRNPEKRKWWIETEAWMVRHFDRIPADRWSSDPAFKADPQDSHSGQISDDGVPGFTVYNLRGGVNVSKNTTVTMSVENFTDEKYRMKDSRIDGPGINFLSAIEVRF